MAAIASRLVPLETREGDEVTVYVKGFLGAGEEPARFEGWHRSHRALVESHGWGPRAHGFAWTAGSWLQIPVPVASSAKLAVDVYRALRYARVAALGATVGMAVAEVGARFVAQYFAAARSATADAPVFAAELDALARNHERVRVVAHSLGCRLAVEAIALLPAERRPLEVHLCGPAMVEEEVAAHLPELTRGRAFLYYAPNDLVLALAFPLVAWDRALGVAPPSRAYPGLEVVDASAHFGFRVHLEYKNRFAAFAARREAA